MFAASCHGVRYFHARHMVHSLYAGVSYLRHGIAETLADDYHPEMHYTRGRGPKWHEKHAVALEVANSRR